MLSKNNFQERLRKMEQKNEHFSIRKLTVGAASVLIGLTFLGFSGHTVHADNIGSTPKETTYTYEETKPKNNATPKVEGPTSTTTTNPTQPDLPKSGKQPWGVVTDTTTPVAAPPTITNSTNPNIGSTTKQSTTYIPEPVVPTITEGTETKTVGRTIKVHNPITDEISILADQSVTFTRPSYYNEQTKEYTYGEWKLSDGSANFAAVTAPTFEGYTPNVKDFPAETIDPNKMSSKTTTTTISYQKNVTPTTSTPGLFESYSVTAETGLDNLHETTDNSMYQDAKDAISKIVFMNNSTGEKQVIYDRSKGIGNLDDVTAEWINPINTNVDKATMSGNLAGTGTATVDKKNPTIKIIYGPNSEIIKETGNKVFPIQGGHQIVPWYGQVIVQGAEAKNPTKPVQIIAGINDLSSDQIAALIDTTNLDKLTANKPVSYTWATPLKPGDTQGTVKITFSDKDKDGNPTYLNVELPTDSINVVAGIAGNPLAPEDKPAFNGGVAGIPETQPDKPAFNGGVAGIPETQPDKPAFNGGVAGIPLTQDDKPAFNGGVAGIPLTQDDKPAFNGGVAGTPLTQDDKPAFEGGVSGIPETQPDLPVAPLPEEPETPTDNNVPGQPVDTNEGTVAPHSTDNPDNGDNSVETPVVHATEAVKADNTDNGVTAPVHAAAVAHNDEKQENTLPQTGAKATTAGVLGLMLASVGAIFGLAATKKRKN